MAGWMAAAILCSCLTLSGNPAGLAARSTATPSQTPASTTASTPTATASATPTVFPSPTALDPAEIGAPGIGDPYFPDMGNGGYDVQHYDLALSVDMTQGTIQSEAKITARSLQTLGRFDLDLNGFTISSVSIDGQAAASHSDR